MCSSDLRKYADAFQTKAGNELSARVEHAGTSFYFPLRTSDRKMAASRAAEIYKAVRTEGWEKANERFSRELSVAFHWADDPVAWTYTTIQTRVGREVRRPFGGSSRSDARLQAAIAEPDEGVRQSLCWCLDQQPSCLCVAAFATIAEALREVPRRPVGADPEAISRLGRFDPS